VIVSLIAAMDRKRGISAGDKLPWRLSADLKGFRELTMRHHNFQEIHGQPLHLNASAF